MLAVVAMFLIGPGVFLGCLLSGCNKILGGGGGKKKPKPTIVKPPMVVDWTTAPPRPETEADVVHPPIINLEADWGRRPWLNQKFCPECGANLRKAKGGRRKPVFRDESTTIGVDSSDHLKDDNGS